MIGMQVPTRKGAILTAVRLSHRKRSRDYFVWMCSKCSEDTELWPDGRIVTCRFDVLKYAPCGCSGSPAFDPRQMEIRAIRFAEKIGAEFLGWAGEYAGNTTKCVLNCPEHGIWTTGGFNHLKRGRGCPVCGMNKRRYIRLLPEQYYVDKAQKAIENKPWELIGRLEPYKGALTKIGVYCEQHGMFEGTYHYVRGGLSTCTGCTDHGFSRVRPAVVYCLVSECGGYYKIGITRSLHRRAPRLRKVTPFSLKVLATWSGMGEQVREVEKSFHQEFESAGFKGFEGATEWLKADPLILKRLSDLPVSPTNVLEIFEVG